MRYASNLKKYFSYFHDIGSLICSETSHARSMTSKGDNVLHFYRLEATQDSLDAVKIFYVTIFGAKISLWRLPLHFARVLLYQISSHAKRDVFVIVKVHFTNTQKSFFS